MNDIQRPMPVFPGFEKSQQDFNPIRDQRRALPLWFDVDLSAARSISAATALVLPVAGNVLYIDQDTVNVGNAVVHFQDTTLSAASAPITVGPGSIFKVPFTQLLIENAAQAGKRLRVFYGVDIDFLPSLAAQVVISGSVTVSSGNVAIIDGAFPEYSNSYANITNMAANTPQTIVAPASNTNGIRVINAAIHATGAGSFLKSLIAKTSAPTTVIDGDVILAGFFGPSGSNKPENNPVVVDIPAGKGLYVISAGAESTSLQTVTYKLL